jgi:hypothetical protein
MTKKVWKMMTLAVLLAGLSLYYNRDRFARDHIHIYDRSRPARAVPGRAQTANPIMFGFDRPLRIKSLSVVPVSDPETNLWHLVSESNSVPITEFNYGTRIAGMHSAVKGARPGPLEPGVKYRLIVEARSLKAEHDFTPVAAPEADTP